MKKERAAVDRLGFALVYPLAGKKDPPSLWAELHPGTKMRWDWDASADDRVVSLWHERARLAASGDVAYAKWFQGRATFFSLPVFHALLADLHSDRDPYAGIPTAASDILEVLRENSPRSTKEIRLLADLRGKAAERIFNHAMKWLWTRLAVVGVGEVEDGAFPSLAVSATEMHFEDLWNARSSPPAKSRAALRAALDRSPAFTKALARAKRSIAADGEDDASGGLDEPP